MSASGGKADIVNLGAHTAQRLQWRSRCQPRYRPTKHLPAQPRDPDPPPQTSDEEGLRIVLVTLVELSPDRPNCRFLRRQVAPSDSRRRLAERSNRRFIFDCEPCILWSGCTIASTIHSELCDSLCESMFKGPENAHMTTRRRDDPCCDRRK